MDMSVRFVLDGRDKALLEEIARRDGDASMSAVLRRLIRNEAALRNIQIDDKATANEQYADGAVVAK